MTCRRIRRSCPLPAAVLALAPVLHPRAWSEGLFELRQLEQLSMQTRIGSVFSLILMSLIRAGYDKNEIIATLIASVEDRYEEAKRVVEQMEKATS